MSNDPSLTDGASASLPAAYPAPEGELLYAIVRKARVPRYVNEEVGVAYELVPDKLFTVAASAYESARNILAADSPFVVRLPLGYKIMRQHEEFRAAKHLRAIRALLTGDNGPFQLEEEMSAVVEICSRIFHAYRMLREAALKKAIVEGLNKSSTEELAQFARAIGVMPEEFKDDPFQEEGRPPFKRV